MGRLMRALLLLVASMLLACSSTDPGLRLVTGDAVSNTAIDTQPLKLLPAGALMVGQIDAQALFRSNVGPQVNQIIQRLLPLGSESNFQPQRDVRKIYTAGYAMQGADFCAVLQGNFDVASIQRAAQARARTPSGAAVVHTRYGNYDLYTVSNVGFVVLTQFTILSGNETGLRRALDRLRFGWTKSSITPWMEELLVDEKAAFAMVGDLTGQGVVSAAADKIPFLAGLKMVRILGDFQPPGMNVVGSLTYDDPAAASRGAQGLGQVQQLAYFASLLTTWGFGGQMPALEVAEQADHVAFATRVDTGTASLLLSLLSGLILPT